MSFKKVNIPYKDTGLFSKAFIDCLDGSSNLKSFYKYTPSVTAFAEVVKELEKHKYPRKLLSNSIKEYYSKNASGAASEATLVNIKKLEDKNCFTITTGHQLCLFTGPLYFIFKIMSAINLAEKLNKEYPAKHFVPVYWMATEDHDFAEVNHANLFGKKIEWNIDSMNQPVGRLSLSSLQPTLDALFGAMGDLGENTQELKKLISESYSADKTLGQATFTFVNALFGKYGLVVIQPDNVEFKKVFAHIITDELQNGNSFKLVTETNKKLVEAGLEPQVNPREINLFYIDEQGRNRIEKKDGKLEVLNTGKTFGIDEVEKSPEKFSPNVLLRPVYQQSILPNAAYVGGPSEIVYWLELKAVFEFYKVPFPVLMPRNFALMVNNPIVQKMEKIKLSAADLFTETEALIKEVMTRMDGLPDIEKVGEELKVIYLALAKKVQEVDPTLVATTEAELQKQLNALKNLETKLMRVKKQKEETSVTKIRKIKEYLFPNGDLQERTENFIPLYLQQGPALIELIKESFDPFNFSVEVFLEE